MNTCNDIIKFDSIQEEVKILEGVRKKNQYIKSDRMHCKNHPLFLTQSANQPTTKPNQQIKMKSFIAIALFALFAVASAQLYGGYGRGLGGYGGIGGGYGRGIGYGGLGAYNGLGGYGGGLGRGIGYGGLGGYNGLGGYGVGYGRGIGAGYGGIGGYGRGVGLYG